MPDYHLRNILGNPFDTSVAIGSLVFGGHLIVLARPEALFRPRRRLRAVPDGPLRPRLPGPAGRRSGRFPNRRAPISSGSTSTRSATRSRYSSSWSSRLARTASCLERTIRPTWPTSRRSRTSGRSGSPPRARPRCLVGPRRRCSTCRPRHAKGSSRINLPFWGGRPGLASGCRLG